MTILTLPAPARAALGTTDAPLAALDGHHRTAALCWSAAHMTTHEVGDLTVCVHCGEVLDGDEFEQRAYVDDAVAAMTAYEEASLPQMPLDMDEDASAYLEAKYEEWLQQTA